MSDGFERKTGKIIPLDYDAVAGEYEDASPVCLSHRDKAILLSQLQYAKWRARWERDGRGVFDEEWSTIKQWVTSLIAKLLGFDECGQRRECTDYPPHSSMIDIAPADPFVNPEYIPAGWAYPPFWVSAGDLPIWSAVGIQAGDLITDITRFPGGGFPPAPIIGGFARFRVTVQAGDELEIHLLGFPGAGYVWIQKDENPLTLETYDLNVDVVNIPPELGELTIWEWHVEGSEGEAHVVDVTFMPSFGDELIPFRYGGGLRKITICRDVPESEECMLEDVWQGEENPCELWKRVDGEDMQFANLALCAPSYRLGENGMEVSNDGGETWESVELPEVQARNGTSENNRCIASANAAAVLQAMHYEVCSKYSATVPVLWIATAIAAFLLSLFGGVIGAAAFVSVIAPLLLYSSALTNTAFDSAVYEELKCILFCAATDNDGIVEFDFEQVQAEVTSRYSVANIWNVIGVYLLVVDAWQGGAEGLKRAGATTSVTTDTCECVDCPGEWCRRYTFFGTTDGWTLERGTITANGIDGVYVNSQTTENVQMSLTFGTTRVNAFAIDYDKSANSGANGIDAVLTYLNGAQTSITFWNNGTGTIAYYKAFGANMDKILFGINAGTGYGAIKVRQVTLWGEGVPPPGGQACDG